MPDNSSTPISGRLGRSTLGLALSAAGWATAVGTVRHADRSSVGPVDAVGVGVPLPAFSAGALLVLDAFGIRGPRRNERIGVFTYPDMENLSRMVRSHGPPLVGSAEREIG